MIADVGLGAVHVGDRFFDWDGPGRWHGGDGFDSLEPGHEPGGVPGAGVTPRPGFDPASLVSGVIVIAARRPAAARPGRRDRAAAPYVLPAVLAALGGILLACGLAGPPRGRS